MTPGEVPRVVCWHCGQPESEHHHEGACYGLCGDFAPVIAEYVAADIRAFVDAVFVLCAPGRPSSPYDWAYVYRGLASC